jgi:hypothetical protein
MRLFARKLREMLNPAVLDREVDEEVRFHIEMEAARNVAKGMSQEEARRIALRDFGGTDRFTEATRDARRLPWLEETIRDARIGIRQLRRTPGFTFVSILTLALAIGANTAIFSVINSVLLAPLPFRDSKSLVVAWETDRTSKTEREPASYPDFVDFQKRSHTLRQLEAVSGADIAMTSANGEPSRVASMLVTHGYFDMIGKRAIVGRLFTAADDRHGGPSVTVFGENFWRT